MSYKYPTNSDDLIDSRQIIERIADLEAEDDDENPLEPEDLEELETLRALAEEGESYAADWYSGETMIRDSYFEEYARELADDIGAIPRDAGWPTSYIDWEAAAAALRQDYSSIDFDGVDYWVRS